MEEDSCDDDDWDPTWHLMDGFLLSFLVQPDLSNIGLLLVKDKAFDIAKVMTRKKQGSKKQK